MKKIFFRVFIALVTFCLGVLAVFMVFALSQTSLDYATTPAFIEDKSEFPAQSQSSSLLFDGEVRGCGDFIAYRTTQDETKVVGISADGDELKLNRSFKVFDIGKEKKNLDVFIYDFGRDKYLGYGGLCFDLIRGDLEPVKWTATSGKARISAVSCVECGYNITVILSNVSFESEGRDPIKLDKVVMKDVSVGWIPG